MRLVIFGYPAMPTRLDFPPVFSYGNNTLNQALIHTIVEAYGHAGAQILNAQKGYRNQSYAVRLADGRTLNLILYKREPHILGKIQNANYVSNFLTEQGMPTRRTADPRITKLQGKTTERYAALYTYLPGKTIPWEAYTMEHIKVLGGTMSTMHARLRTLARGELPSVAAECAELARRMDHYFANKGVQAALASKLGLKVENLSLPFDKLDRLPGQQALHMDFVRGNILFDESATITGVLDFEKAAWGHPVFDIARTLAFLIVDCKYKEEAKVRKYFLHSGYNKRGASKFGPPPLLENLLHFFLLHDFYKFLRHNPYESLEDNEHFVRTRDFLLRRGSIAYLRDATIIVSNK